MKQYCQRKKGIQLRLATICLSDLFILFFCCQIMLFVCHSIKRRAARVPAHPGIAAGRLRLSPAPRPPSPLLPRGSGLSLINTQPRQQLPGASGGRTLNTYTPVGAVGTPQAASTHTAGQLCLHKANGGDEPWRLWRRASILAYDFFFGFFCRAEAPDL